MESKLFDIAEIQKEDKPLKTTEYGSTIIECEASRKVPVIAWIILASFLFGWMTSIAIILSHMAKTELDIILPFPYMTLVVLCLVALSVFIIYCSEQRTKHILSMELYNKVLFVQVQDIGMHKYNVNEISWKLQHIVHRNTASSTANYSLKVKQKKTIRYMIEVRDARVLKEFENLMQKAKNPA
jgi:hypothetical protein